MLKGTALVVPRNLPEDDVRLQPLRSRSLSRKGALKTTVFLSLFTFVLSGCRHKQTAVYAPPPPALAPAPATTAGGAVAARGGVTSGQSAGTTQGLPPYGGPTAEGTPISSQVGIASWYGPGFTGHKVADGTFFDPNALTAAHLTLPLGTIVRVTNLTNNEQVLLRINDRGPFVDGRIIDLSPAAAKAIDMYRAGIAKVRVEAFAPPAGSDPTGRWCVQIGAFLDPADALQLKNDLKRRYATARVSEFASSTGHWVRIDPQGDDRATAEAIADSIHIPDPGAEPYLVRLN